MKSKLKAILMLLSIILLQGCGIRSNTGNQSVSSVDRSREVYDQWMSINIEPEDRKLTTLNENGLGYNRHYVILKAVTPNPRSPLKGMSAQSNTSIMFKPEEGKGMPEIITYQHAGGAWMDEEGNMIFLFYEFRPPEDTHIWVAEGFGKWKGLQGHGKWHWLWPQGREKPEIPEGYSYPNAYEMNWVLPDPDADPPPPVKVGSSIYFDGNGEMKDKIGMRLYEPPKYIVEKDLVSGMSYKQSWLEGEVLMASKGSPVEGLAVVGQSTEALGESGDILYQMGMLEFTAADGSQVFMFAEYRPPDRPRLWVTAASGKFEGLNGEGTWLNAWPGDWENPEMPDLPGNLSAWEFAWDLP